jgi:hypothetical protein
MQRSLIIDYSQAIDLTLMSDSGFSPFSPIFEEMTYSVRLAAHEYTGVLKSPWKHIENGIDIIYKDTISPFTTNESLPYEGNVSLWDGNRQTPQIVTGIREIDQPPDLTLPEFYNVLPARTGVVYSIVNKIPSYENAGITSDIEIKGGFEVIKQVILFLLSRTTNYFYISMPYNFYDTIPDETAEPEYYLFGKNIPETRYQCSGTGAARWFHAWKVKCISDLTIVHNYRNNFSIKLRLGLEI